MEEEFGIDVLKDICLTLTQVAIKLEDATDPDSAKGEKIALTEGVALLVFLVPKAISYAGQVGQIKDEFMNLDADELGELKDYIAEKLDLTNDKIEALVEAGLDWLDATYDLIQSVRELKA